MIGFDGGLLAVLRPLLRHRLSVTGAATTLTHPAPTRLLVLDLVMTPQWHNLGHGPTSSHHRSAVLPGFLLEPVAL